MTVSDFILPNRNWNIEKLKRSLNNHRSIKNIQGITISSHDMKDWSCWGLNSSGKFSTKSATWMAHDPQSFHNYNWIHKWIWKIDTMPKIKVFLWQVCHKAIPAKGLLLAMGLHINPSYSLCLDDIESIDHLFKERCMTKKVWDYAEEHGWIPSGMSPDNYTSSSKS